MCDNVMCTNPNPNQTDPKVIKRMKHKKAAGVVARNRILNLSVRAPPVPPEPVFASFDDMQAVAGQRACNNYCVTQHCNIHCNTATYT